MGLEDKINNYSTFHKSTGQEESFPASGGKNPFLSASLRCCKDYQDKLQGTTLVSIYHKLLLKILRRATYV
jgi:hypothetical protein